MKRILLSLCLVFLTIFGFGQDTAMRGGFIEYRHVTGKVYEARVTMYVACPHDSFTPVIRCVISGQNVTGGNTVFVSNSEVSGYGTTCSTQTACSGGSTIGVNKLVWTRSFDLDTFTGCDVTFFAEGPRRDPGITTGWANIPMWLYSYFNQCKGPGTSSPAFAATNQSFLQIVNQDAAFNFGTTDKGDFDSVSYALVPPVTYPGYMTTGTYSALRPMCFFGFPNQNLQWPAGFHLDPLTGMVMYRPTSNCFGTIVVEHSYWKRINGTMERVGQVFREHASQVLSSNGNKNPTILSPFSKQACAGQTTCFTVQTDDDDTTDTVTLEIESTIPGLDIQINNSQTPHATAQICWTPDSTFISNVPYQFLMKASDNFCPLNGKTLRAFTFFVRETPKAQRSITVANCGRVLLNSTPIKTYPGLSANWSIFNTNNQKVDSSYKLSDTLTLAAGTYYSTFSVRTSTPCFEYYYDTFVVAPYNQVDIIGDTLFCDNDSVRVTAVNTETNAYTFAWTAGSYIGTDSFFTYPANDTHTLYLKVTWDAYCEVNDSFVVNVWKTQRELKHAQPIFCITDSAYLSVINPGTSYSRLWSTQETGDSILVKQAGWYSLQTTYFQGCVQVDSVEVKTLALPQVNIISPAGVCPGDSTLVYAQVSGNGPFHFVWNNNATDSFRYSGNGLVEVGVTDVNGCFENATASIITYSLPMVQVVAPDSICPGDSTLVYAQVSGNGPFEFIWNDNTTDSFRYSSVGQTSVTVTDDNGCENTADASIAAFSLPVPDDSVFIVCAGEAIRLFSQDSAGIRVYYSFGDSGNYYVPVQSEQGQVLIISSNSCPATYPIDITVNQPQNPAFTYTEVNPAEVEFSVTQPGNAYYHWNFGDGNSASSVSPTHTYAGNGPYTVTLTVTDSITGCIDSSSQTLSFHVGLSRNYAGKIQAMPNPFGNTLLLTMPDAGEGRIYSASGQLVWSGRIEKGVAFQIETKAWAPGMYILQVQTQGTVVSEKLIRK